ncbi:hypothetical protein Tco_0401914 [Tanacetum coccineum]
MVGWEETLGREILDGLLILSETIDWYKKRKKKIMLFKVDFEKAFDSVSWRSVPEILNIFYIAFGLKINIHKSNVYRVGVSFNEVEIMASYTGCEAVFFPFTYLGLPIGSNMIRIANWQPFISRFKARLSGWKANLLSIGGRLTFIKSVLGSLALRTPKTLAWVKWSNILASLDKGCLGVGSLKAFNMSLLLKRRWRLFHNSNALWVHVVKAIHGEEADCFIQQRIANGSWFWDWSRPVNMGRTKAEFDALISDIASLEPKEPVDSDTCIWSLSHNDKFSVNSVRKHIYELYLPSLSLSYRLNLSSRGLDIDSIMCTVLCSLPFPHMASGIFGFSHGVTQRKRRTAVTPSLLLPVEPYGSLEIISLSALIL